MVGGLHQQGLGQGVGLDRGGRGSSRPRGAAGTSSRGGRGSGHRPAGGPARGRPRAGRRRRRRVVARPMRWASSASTRSPRKRISVARPRPTTRGSSQVAPMSAPDRPTLVKRKRKLADRAQTRKSDASAITAPAPAAVPLTPATTGSGTSRRRCTTAPGHARELQELARLHRHQGADDLLDVAAGAEAAAGTREQHDLDVVVVLDLGQEVAQVGVDVEGQRVEPLGTRERDREDAIVERDIEMTPLAGQRGGGAVGHLSGARGRARGR